jgi:hypothetical protein
MGKINMPKYWSKGKVFRTLPRVESSAPRRAEHIVYRSNWLWCSLLFALVVCCVPGCNDADANPANSTEQTITNKIAPRLIEPSLQEFDLQLGSERFLLGLCELNSDRLTLALPLHPSHARPYDLKSRAGDTTRIVVLSRREPPTSETGGLIGTWKTVSAHQSGKPSQAFLGHTLVFGKNAVVITESPKSESYEVPYRLNDLIEISSNQQTSVQVLRQRYGADVTLNSEGAVEALTVSGVNADGKQLNFNDTIVEQITGLNSLERLTLTDFEEGMTAERLTFLRRFHHLKRLDIRNTNICDRALAPISELPQLKVLKLEFNHELTDGLTEYLQPLTHLVELDLAFVNISDVAMPAVSQLSGLERLYLYGAGITDHGVKHLGAMQNLRVLYLGGEEEQDVTDASVPVLSKLQSLELLGLYGTRISHNGADKLKTVLSNCDILAPPATVESQSEAAVDVDLSGNATGTLILDGQQFALKHVLAYKHRLDAENVISVLLTTEPPPAETLKQSLERYGNDFLFAAHIPQIRLRYRLDGSIDRFHIYANDFTINGPGEHLIADGEITSQGARGGIRMNDARIFEGKSYRVDAEFDVELIK